MKKIIKNLFRKIFKIKEKNHNDDPNHIPDILKAVMNAKKHKNLLDENGYIKIGGVILEVNDNV